ncbi:MAG: hypothetical protein E7554_03920 [Ruminococcaceae bacterium]|nr:hypothetical protein [Oscillospiraceae bacterium]
MAGFIEQFYYGNIEPQSRSTRQHSRVQKQMRILSDREEELTETLTADKRQKFLDYVNAWGEINSESNLDSFIMGFRLGAAFTYDTFVSTEAPFTDYSGT